MNTKNKFRILSILLCFCLAFSGIAYAAYSEASYLKLYINNEEMIFNSPISLADGEVMVPLREILDLFGAKIDWMPEDKIAICTLGTNKLVVQADSRTGKIGTALVDINPIPYIAGTTMFVPLSFVCKGMNLSYSYDAVMNAAYITQNPTVTPYYITNETYLAKSADGVYTATHNQSASYRRLNTLSSAATGEMFYEIDITDVPEEFSTANLVITATKINVRGTYYVSEVTGGLDGNKFGTLDFTDAASITMTEGDSAPTVSPEPFAKAASATTAYIDITEYVKAAKENAVTMLRLHLDYHTWETKASVDGARIRSKGKTATSPRLEIVQEPQYVQLPDVSGIKVSYKTTPAQSSERVLYTNGLKSSVIKNSSNAGNSLNNLTVKGSKTSDITYTFPINAEGSVKGANVVFYGRATASGMLTATNAATGQSFTTAVAASADYGKINIDVTMLTDVSEKELKLKLTYTPDGGASGDMYIYSINSENAPMMGITTQTVKQTGGST